ncbi:hypothetical protein B0H13DRAFT_2345077 [Mycena leptocephala]|nr:hypothetical protein B0H13DRAFT_2345077 [Mycena leptocephala]
MGFPPVFARPMQPLRALLPFFAFSLIHGYLTAYRRGIQVRQSASVGDSTPTTAVFSTIVTDTDSYLHSGSDSGSSIATALPATSPTGTVVAHATASATTVKSALLSDCLGGTAACTFTPTGLRFKRTASGNYAEMTPLGLPIENCNDANVTATGHFSGSVTLTDNWSQAVDAGAEFSVPGYLNVGGDVKTSVEKGKEIQMAQSLDYPIAPNMKAALVASASFIGIFGTMDMQYPSDFQTIRDVVYFTSAQDPGPVASLMTIGCDQPWPIWNATSAVATTAPACAVATSGASQWLARTGMTMGCIDVRVSVVEERWLKLGAGGDGPAHQDSCGTTDECIAHRDDDGVHGCAGTGWYIHALFLSFSMQSRSGGSTQVPVEIAPRQGILAVADMVRMASPQAITPCGSEHVGD